MDMAWFVVEVSLGGVVFWAAAIHHHSMISKGTPNDAQIKYPNGLWTPKE